MQCIAILGLYMAIYVTPAALAYNFQIETICFDSTWVLNRSQSVTDRSTLGKSHSRAALYQTHFKLDVAAPSQLHRGGSFCYSFHCFLFLGGFVTSNAGTDLLQLQGLPRGQCSVFPFLYPYLVNFQFFLGYFTIPDTITTTKRWI